MKTQTTKTLASIALILMIAISAFMVVAPSALAVVMPPVNFSTVFAYIGAAPNPVGLGQTVLVTYRLDQPAAGALERVGHFNGTSVTITKPDGKTETFENLPMDSTSSGWFSYSVNQVGTYKFQMHFPKNAYWYNTTTTQTYYTYAADDSNIYELVVQEEPVPGYGRSPPLPTEYWTRPIYGENKGWWQVADNWLMPDYDKAARSFAGSTAFAPYTSGPKSPHILWTKSIIPGGLAGGPMGDQMYYSGISYEQFFDPLVIQGTILYGEHGLTSSSPTLGTRFLDLYTGQDYPLMYMVNTSISFAQTLEYDSPNEHGVLTYLVITSGDNWYFYDFLPNSPQPPRLRFTLSGMTGLTNTAAFTFGPNGEILSCIIGGTYPNRWIAMFNSTRAVKGPGYLVPGTIDTWSPSGTLNASRRLNEGSGAVPTAQLAAYEAKSHSPLMGIEWNATIPDAGVQNIIGTAFAVAGTGLFNYQEGWLLTGVVDSTKFPLVYSDVGYDIGAYIKNRAADGTYPTSLTQTFAANRTMIHDIHNRYSNHILDGKYVRYDEGEEVYYCFDMKTGKLLWKTDPIGNAWAVFVRQYEPAYGLIITCGFDGHVRAYNLTNGKLEWDFYKGNAPYQENAYGTYPEYAGFTIADHTVYTTADEHSSDAIIWRGAQLWAINTDNGELRWKINGMYRHPVVVDGILIALNSYDGQVYAFGKGPSKTTISAPQTQVTLGQKVMLTGTVTDQTPAQKDTPAISDDSMGLWMEYLHQQKTYPTNATGVPVTIDVIDANGNYRNIGTVTSDASGNFKLWWAPDIPGEYTIIATFAGSNSYGSSYAETFMGVSEAPPATPPPQYPVPIDYTLTIVAATIVLLIAIAIVGILMLRKRP